MSQDSSSSASTQGHDMERYYRSAGNQLCQAVTSILTEASSIDAVVPTERLLNVVRQFAFLHGFLLNYHDGGRLMRVLPGFAPTSSTTEASPSPK